MNTWLRGVTHQRVGAQAHQRLGAEAHQRTPERRRCISELGARAHQRSRSVGASACRSGERIIEPRSVGASATSERERIGEVGA